MLKREQTDLIVSDKMDNLLGLLAKVDMQMIDIIKTVDIRREHLVITKSQLEIIRMLYHGVLAERDRILEGGK